MDINAAMTTATESMIASAGTSALYTPLSGSQKPVTVLFDNDYKAMDLNTGAIMSLGPVAFCKTSDLTGTIQGGTLYIGATTYTIAAIEPDGTGMTLLRLRK